MAGILAWLPVRNQWVWRGSGFRGAGLRSIRRRTRRVTNSSVLHFSDQEAANAADPVLNLIEQPSRRSTLVARRGERAGKVVYSFTIDLQGPGETVFFDA